LFKKKKSLLLTVSKETINNIYFTNDNPTLFDFHTTYTVFAIHTASTVKTAVSSYGMEKLN